MNIENALFLAKSFKKAVFGVLACAFLLAASDFNTPLPLAEKLLYVLAVIGIGLSGFWLLHVFNQIIADYEAKLVNLILLETKQVIDCCRWCPVLRTSRN